MSEIVRTITDEEVNGQIAELEGQFPPLPPYEYAPVKPEYTAAEVDQRLEVNIDTIEGSSTPEEREKWRQMTMSKRSGDDQLIWRLTKM